MSKHDQPVEMVLAAIKKQQEQLNELHEVLITRARLQEYTEQQFNALVDVARGGIELVERLQVGDTVPPDWATRRDELVERARRLIQDA
ncbi:MAG TPA: hypothetical protein VH593_19200 [Ktedonobacteraceae bacterium]|jgi:hypothetical protein